MSDDLPYRAEYAKSGRASCKGCKSPIAKDTLRLAVMVQVETYHDIRSLGICTSEAEDS
jgi:poly [ADP-ribose] polymerase